MPELPILSPLEYARLSAYSVRRAELVNRRVAAFMRELAAVDGGTTGLARAIRQGRAPSRVVRGLLDKHGLALSASGTLVLAHDYAATFVPRPRPVGVRPARISKPRLS